MVKKLAVIAVLILAASAVIFQVRKQNPILNNQNQPSQSNSRQNSPKISIIAQNLEIPWGLAFLPDGEIIFTERKGRVRLIDKDSNLNHAPIAQISDVKTISEGGLLGIAPHPDFKNNHFVYLYYTYEGDENGTLNKVVRYVFDGDKLQDEKVIIDKIPGAPNHNGGRIKFGPDRFLYITTGDAQNPSLAQNTESLAGKILRIAENGQIPHDNPFNNAVYSYGHRNPQGIAWDNLGRLWAAEHGSNAEDELNLIEMGQNYGWPEIRGQETKTGLKTPVLASGRETWAPAGASFKNGSIFFGGLRGSSLFEYNIESLKLTEHLEKQFGRIRDVVLGSDNALYITTSNRDGRGIPSQNDDKIIKVEF